MNGPRLTERERLVREAADAHGITMQAVARQVGYATAGGFYRVLKSRKPHAPTLNRIRDWLRLHGVDVELAALRG